MGLSISHDRDNEFRLNKKKNLHLTLIIQLHSFEYELYVIADQQIVLNPSDILWTVTNLHVQRRWQNRKGARVKQERIVLITLRFG